MAEKITVHVDGLKEVQAALRELPDATAKNVLRRVGREGLEPIAEAMRGAVPVASNALKNSITVGTRLTRRQRAKHRKDGRDDVEVFAGAGSDPAAHLQEFGTVKFPPQPFVRPAWDEGKDALLEGIKDAMWAEIEKAAERLARKTARLKAKNNG